MIGSTEASIRAVVEGMHCMLHHHKKSSQADYYLDT